MTRPAGPLTGVSFVAGVATGIGLAKVPFPRPGAKPGAIRGYFRGNATGARISVAGQLISAASLAAFTAQVARAAEGRARVAALATAAAFAGWLTFKAGEDPQRDVAFHRAMFLAGGPAHGAAFGVLLAALGTGTDALPERPALAIAAVNLLAPLYLLDERAAWLIPAGRFPGLIAVGIAGPRLAR